ncbi:MAG: hypothetical protein H6R45_1234 [Proteobacteria bacterium]|nr:hypothetical protein [Pseudomonadota bacterium]
MSLPAITLIAFAMQPSDGVEPSADASPASGKEVVDTPRPGMRKASMNESGAFLSEVFDTFDRDHSDFLTPAEASVLEPRDGFRDKTLPPAPAAGEPDPAGEAKWMAKLDTDRDGRVNRDEYISYMMPWTLWQGIPKDWKPKQAAS